MRTVNKVILIGCLGHDPEVKDAGKVKIATFSLATKSEVKDDAGKWQERVEWHNIVLWDRLADIAAQYLKKGSRAYIEGHLRTSSWEDKRTGEKRYRTEVVANQMLLLGDAQRVNSSGKGQSSAREEPAINMDADYSPF